MTRGWRLVLPALLGGLLLGVFAGSRLERAGQRRMRREGPNPEKALKKLRRELKLTDAQTSAIRAIMASRKDQFAAARREGAERVRLLRAGIDKEIEPLLDDAQKAKFTALRERWDRRMREEGPPDAKKP
ncbi:MAG: hypothetical protein M0D55_12770 [Elusimicrobiota bacterium]|nr:MAG: hypothetical protein M0D55_12770 [Elusimicrobiota bacterium]